MLKFNKTKEEEIREEVITLAIKEEELKQAYSNIPVQDKKVQVENTTSKKEKVKKKKNKKETKKKTEVKKEKKVKVKKKFSFKKLLLSLFLIILLLIAIDIVAVTKFDKGPFFAIPNKKVNINNKNKEYYGLGYKVTKYSKKINNKQRKIEFWWNLIKISKLPKLPQLLKLPQKKVSLKDSTLLKEILKDEKKTYSKYKNKSLKINSKLSELDPESHKVTAKYTDEEKKTDLVIICTMDKNNQNTLNKLEAEKDVKITGNMKKIKTKVKDDKNTVNVYLNNCSLKQ